MVQYTVRMHVANTTSLCVSRYHWPYTLIGKFYGTGTHKLFLCYMKHYNTIYIRNFIEYLRRFQIWQYLNLYSLYITLHLFICFFFKQNVMLFVSFRCLTFSVQINWPNHTCFYCISAQQATHIFSRLQNNKRYNCIHSSPKHHWIRE